ncbi:MAG: type II toxin-antitoxin system RelE/ParE family toxin [Tepidisphaeraceae bacterium]
MSRYILSALARRDVQQIWDYLQVRAGIDVADRVVADIRIALRKLAGSPRVGHRREDLTDKPVKFFRVHSYLIVYRAIRGGIGVARILHGARDLPRLLSDKG